MDCQTTTCIDGKRTKALLVVYGVGLSPDISLEGTQWVLEDGTDKPDPSNLEGPAAMGGCSITPVVGFSVGPVYAGKGTSGTFDLGPTFGIGIGCQAFGAGRSRTYKETVECCLEPGSGPIMRPRR